MKLRRCVMCGHPITPEDDEDFTKGDEPELCALCNEVVRQKHDDDEREQ